ncbi:MAG TPA: hypothetical protein VGV09_18370 [Steroidobacteraceae bacterium]|nr:hypothetical protein [Steroidobacteraceae bacterium]
MPKGRRNTGRQPFDEAAFVVRARKTVPHEFVLDALASLAPSTRPMFGCLAVYIEDKIVLILRDRQDSPRDNGVWLATTAEHHASLQHDFPSMRSIEVFGQETTHWQVLPADAPDFEAAALRACALISARDPRIGKVPRRRKAKPRAAP